RGAERHLRDPGREAVLLLVAQLGKAVVAETDHLVHLLRRLAQTLQRRLRKGEDLLIVLVLVDDLLAHIEVIERRQRAHALAHVLIVAGDLHHLVEELLREEMRVGVDAHGGSPVGAIRARLWWAAARDRRRRDRRVVIASIGRSPRPRGQPATRQTFPRPDGYGRACPVPSESGDILDSLSSACSCWRRPVGRTMRWTTLAPGRRGNTRSRRMP